MPIHHRRTGRPAICLRYPQRNEHAVSYGNTNRWQCPLLWRNVTVVRVCLLTRTLGGNTRLPGAPSTYRDCNGAEKDHPAGDTITRHVEEFGLRNNMKQ